MKKLFTIPVMGLMLLGLGMMILPTPAHAAGSLGATGSPVSGQSFVSGFACGILDPSGAIVITFNSWANLDQLNCFMNFGTGTPDVIFTGDGTGIPCGTFFSSTSHWWEEIDDNIGHAQIHCPDI